MTFDIPDKVINAFIGEKEDFVPTVASLDHYIHQTRTLREIRRNGLARFLLKRVLLWPSSDQRSRYGFMQE